MSSRIKGGCRRRPPFLILASVALAGLVAAGPIAASPAVTKADQQVVRLLRSHNVWSAPTARSRAQAGACEMTDLIVASRQRVRLAMEACGPEFSGLLMDVCCFLRGLEEVEHERGWPLRSAKIVPQLALDRLARHYGLRDEARGDASARVRTWLAADAAFSSK